MKRPSLLTLLLVILSCSPEITPTVSPASCKDLPCRMTTPINPTSPPTWPLTLTGPSDGEPATAVTVNGPFQSLIDASESARLVTYGQARRYMVVDGAGALTVGPLVAVTLKTGGTWQTYTSTVPLNKALAGLVANTLYNVYVYYSGGLQVQVSTDPVDDFRLYKDGDEGYIFVGYVMTDVSAVTVPAKFNGNTYTYLTATTNVGLGVNGNLVLDQGSAVVSTTVPLGCVPSYAQAATLSLQATLVGANGRFVLVSQAGNTILNIELINALNTETSPAYAPFVSAAQVNYLVPGAFDNAVLWVTSFTI